MTTEQDGKVGRRDPRGGATRGAPDAARPARVADGTVNPAADLAAYYERTPVLRTEHAESSLTRVLEQQTAKIPSHWFLAASVGAMAFSAGLEVTGHSRWSRFVGMWSPTLLICGVYNKLVKTLPAAEALRRE